MNWCDTTEGNRSFWEADTLYFAVNPHLPDETDGIVSFVVERKDLATLIYFQTSGSEGDPKWVGLSRTALLASARAVNEHLEASPQDRWLITLPLHHVGGFSVLARCFDSRARFFHMKGKWSIDRFMGLCLRETITLTSLVPAQVFDLVQNGVHAPPGLRAVVVGGGALARDIGLRAVALGWPVLQSFGMTEAASQIATEPLDHLYAGFDPDSLEVLRGWDLDVDDAGTLTIKGPALASGYLVRRGADWTWDPIDPKRGLVTRDRVQVWDHGTRKFLRFLGRESSFVKVLGELVNIASLQSRLAELAAPAGFAPDAAVIVPLPDDRKETRLVLVSDLPPEKAEALRKSFNDRSAGFERIDETHSVPSIPRTAIGKPDVRELTNRLRPSAAAQNPSPLET
jgi:O-succinylbenzoic acid--CoA ligase